MATLIFKSFFAFLSLSLMICLSFCNTLPGDFSTLSNDLDKFTLEEDIFVLFKAWQKEHHKEYETKEEESKRFEIFKSNLKIVNARNSERTSFSSYSLGLNKFADLTFEEFSKSHLSARKIEESLVKEARMSSINKTGHLRLNDVCPNAPSFMDWRLLGAVTTVKDQVRDSCEAGWAFTAVGAIEASTAIATGHLLELSAQQLVSCDHQNFGCAGGLANIAFDYVIKNGGITLDVLYPYTAENGTCDTLLELISAGRINDYNFVLPHSLDSSIACAVAQQPVAVVVETTEEFVFYRNGVIDERMCMNIVPCETFNHWMLIVGYGTFAGQGYWIVKNSWGSDWGVNGYAYVKRNTGPPSAWVSVCNINCLGLTPTLNSTATKLHSAI